MSVQVFASTEALLDYCNTSLGSNLFLNSSGSALDHPPPSHAKPSAAEVWGIGLVFVTIISGCAAVGILLMPLLSRRLYYLVLTYFVGLGVGSLSGSAVFHLLPQAWGLISEDNPDDHDYLNKAWIVILGIYMFFFTDKLLQLLMRFRRGARKGSTEVVDEGPQLPEIAGWGHSERKLSTSQPSLGAGSTTNGNLPRAGSAVTFQSGKSTAQLIPNRELAVTNGGDVGNYVTSIPIAESVLHNSDSDVYLDSPVTPKDLEKQAHALCVHEHEVVYKEGDSVIATVAWMVIFGDGLHNFIDGLSIGAAFSDSVLSGISVSVAVICEEFPHELGDVAILINAGMSLKQALTYNLLSAFTCYLGFILGVMLGELAEASVYIFGLAGGMFLYISLASMIPEMNGTVEKAMEKGMVAGLKTLFLQAAGILTGLALMFLMSYYGSLISFE